MKNTLPLVLFLLFFPLLAHAAGALDEANNIRSGMSKPDGSAGYIQNQYLNSSGAGGGPIDQPASGSGISGNNPNQTNGVTIDAVAAQNPNQIDDGRDLLQAEQDLKASREKSLISYCLIVLGLALVTFVAMKVFQSAPTPVTAWISLILLAALIVMVAIGFVKLLKSYPDGLGPSAGTLAVCAAMLFGSILLVGGSLFSPLGIFGILATGLAFMKSGKNKLAKDLVSSSQSSKQPETAEDIAKRAEQYKNTAGGGK